MLVLVLVGPGQLGAGTAEAERLAPGVISTVAHREFGLALSPDGGTAYFTRGDDIYVAPKVDGTWRPATRWPHSSDAFDGDPFVAPDGQRLFFMSSRGGSVLYPTRPEERPKADIWVSELLADGAWGPPHRLATPVSSPAIEGHASITSDGTLYFFSGREGGLGGHDIYRSVRAGGGFAEPENLGPPINSEAGDGHPFVSSDERYLVFYSHRLGGFGSCDLYISLRDGDRWTEPQNLGPGVNTPDCEMTPHVAPGGSELIFARIHADGSRDLYRVDFTLERWKSRALESRADSDTSTRVP